MLFDCSIQGITEASLPNYTAYSIIIYHKSYFYYILKSS